MKELKAFVGNAPHMIVREQDMVCVYNGCNVSPHPELSAPLCMDHAKKITVQVMLLNNTTVTQATPNFGRTNARKIAEPYAPGGRSRDGLVYFIRFGDRIKIGFTTSLKNRMKGLPYDEILALIPGTVSDEKKLHKKFDDIRITGEWFDHDHRLTDFIKTLPKHELLAA